MCASIRTRKAQLKLMRHICGLTPRSLVQLAVQGHRGPKLGELSMKESTWNLNPIKQGTRWVRMHNVYVSIVPYYHTIRRKLYK